MKRRLPWFSFVIAFYVQANAQQSGPLIDYHQHLFSPAIANLLSDGTVSPVSPPQELERLIAARAWANRDDMVLEQLYTPDAVMFRSNLSWIRGAQSIVAWWKANRSAAVLRLTPVSQDWGLTEGHSISG